MINKHKDLSPRHASEIADAIRARMPEMSTTVEVLKPGVANITVKKDDLEILIERSKKPGSRSLILRLIYGKLVIYRELNEYPLQTNVSVYGSADDVAELFEAFVPKTEAELADYYERSTKVRDVYQKRRGLQLELIEISNGRISTLHDLETPDLYGDQHPLWKLDGKVVSGDEVVLTLTLDPVMARAIVAILASTPTQS